MFNFGVGQILVVTMLFYQPHIRDSFGRPWEASLASIPSSHEVVYSSEPNTLLVIEGMMLLTLVDK